MTHSLGAATEGMSHLKALEAITSLGLLADDVQHRVDQLGPLRVVTLSPVVTSSRLAKDKVVRAEELTERAGAHRVHRARLQIHEDRARHVAATGGLIEVDVDALELEVRISVVRARRVDAVLIANHLPELRADLVAALAA